jgi:hypothetical protein
MHAKEILASPALRGLLSELEPRPGRAQETLRITVAALLVTVVMLTFRMPYLFVGPYLVFILSQRDTILTRALAIALSPDGWVPPSWSMRWPFAWNIDWLRVSLLALCFSWAFSHADNPQPVILLGPLVIFSLFAYAFDTAPFPNELLNQLGWIWAIRSACRSISHPVVVRSADSSGGLPHQMRRARRRRTDVFAVGLRARSCRGCYLQRGEPRCQRH